MAPQKKFKLQKNVENNPILTAFRGYANELDSKHDRYERILKISRNITIESKRIIFLLHSIDGRKSNHQKVLTEAQQRLTKLIDYEFRGVANELKDQDIYQYRGAYSPGLQEFIESYTFLEYLKTELSEQQDSVQVSSWDIIENLMCYEEKVQPANKEVCPDADQRDVLESEDSNKPVTENEQLIKTQFIIVPSEYILGLCDLTGEIMRRCINSLGSGEIDICLKTCKVLQHFYSGYISLRFTHVRDLWRKIIVMRQSLLKAENVCYNIKVRGREAAKWGTVMAQKSNDDVDEGFF